MFSVCLTGVSEQRTTVGILEPVETDRTFVRGTAKRVQNNATTGTVAIQNATAGSDALFTLRHEPSTTSLRQQSPTLRQRADDDYDGDHDVIRRHTANLVLGVGVHRELGRKTDDITGDRSETRAAGRRI